MLTKEEQEDSYELVKLICKGTKFECREYLCIKWRTHREDAYTSYTEEYRPYFGAHLDRIFAVAIVDDTPIWLEEPFTLYHKDTNHAYLYNEETKRIDNWKYATQYTPKISIRVDAVVWENFTLTKPSKAIHEIVGTLPETAEEFIINLPNDDPNSKQVGGTHYKDKAIQPWAYMEANYTKEEFVGFLRGSAHSYLERYKDKGGIEDLKKAIHYIEKLIDVEGGTK